MRKIIHVDMDCFYAAVEVRDNPGLSKQPVAVGGRAERRGVIATCNYIAREFGVHSALSSAVAKKRCPDLIIIPPNLNKYRDVSRVIQNIFHRYTDVIEPLSLDEAYLDVSSSEHHSGSATWIAQQIKSDIFHEVGLTASAGVAPNKFLAKIASDWNKPDGLKVITPEQVDDFVFQLPVEKIHGVGKVTARKLHNLNFRSCGDLQGATETELIERFGKFGKSLFRYARGIDERQVASHRERKSVSVETTFRDDKHSLEELYRELPGLIESLERRLNNLSSRSFKSLFVKIKFSDFTSTTKERRAEFILDDVFQSLIDEAFGRKEQSARLLGIGVRLSETEIVEHFQLELPFH
ncbi:MAG: DNA polymerase IV [Gammaproteobacteria bacterium]|nr:DNA polymerase IV [Gammaproteobacteria bacterium]